MSKQRRLEAADAFEKMILRDADTLAAQIATDIKLELDRDQLVARRDVP